MPFDIQATIYLMLTRVKMLALDVGRLTDNGKKTRITPFSHSSHKNALHRHDLPGGAAGRQPHKVRTTNGTDVGEK